MSLIRNGGFERGNTGFWTSEISGLLEISTLLPKYGTYCGKYTSGGAGSEFIINNDYIEVSPHDLIELLGWVKSADTREVLPCIYTYDADYSYIGYVQGFGRTMTGAYLQGNTQIVVPDGVSYIRAGFRIFNSAAGETFYIDGCDVGIIQPKSCISGDLLLMTLSHVGVSGNTRLDKRDMLQYHTLEAELHVYSVAGVNPTLDVVVYETNHHGAKYAVGTFAQATAAGVERITLVHHTGRQLHVEYVIGGTNPFFDAFVHGQGKGL